MNFTTDQQTQQDLHLFEAPGRDAVYGLFNRTLTEGGAALLKAMFLHPLSDQKAINQRSQTIQFFQKNEFVFPFDPEVFDLISTYLKNRDERSKLSGNKHTLASKVAGLIAQDTEFKTISNGTHALIALLRTTADFLRSIKAEVAQSAYNLEFEDFWQILEDEDLLALLEARLPKKLSFEQLAEYDRLFRFKKYKLIVELLRYIFQLDVYLSVAMVATEQGFHFPEALPAEQQILILEGLYHPHVKNAVANDLKISPEGNVIFLTGANMAGKSTLMKSLGIVVYLAHMGFAVPAKKMRFSVRDGVYTTINLPDSLSMGASHFYAEVLRIKKVAQQLGEGKNLFIIFDELFRGTNVKDAYEATVAITSAFASKPGCMFVVSTHIMEAGETLGSTCPNVQFVYLPTRMDGNKPVYTYRLEQGITEDRHGMLIIRNEGILDILEKNQSNVLLTLSDNDVLY